MVLRIVELNYRKKQCGQVGGSGIFFGFTFVSWTSLPGLGWLTRVVYLNSGISVVVPIVGNAELSAAILGYVDKLNVVREKEVKFFRGNELKIPLIDYDKSIVLKSR